MIFGFLFKSTCITYVQAFTYIGYTVIVVAVIVLLTRFQKQPALKEAVDGSEVLAGGMAW